jgi:cysteine sulfinate desulfinase/cysteine desulfurase-like protein
MSEMGSRKDQIIENLRTRVQDELRQALDQQLSEVTNALSELGQAAIQAEEACESARQELQQQLGELAERIPVMQTGVEQVKQAATEVGIAWP